MKASRVTSRHCLSAPAAFTLVELLVSMTVLSIIVVMLTSLLNSTLKSWTNSESDQERHRGGRALTDFIGQELRAAALPTESLATAGQANLQLLINPTQIAMSDANGGPAYRNADAIFWQAPLATESTYGDIAEVGYFVKWVTTGSAAAPTYSPTLCRFFVNPSTTDSSGTVMPNADFQIYTNPTAWLTPTLIDKTTPADNKVGSTGQKNGYVGLFAENVLGMWVQSYSIDSTELTANHGTFDSRQGYPLRTGQIEKRYLPALIRISVAQIDSKFAARLPAAVTSIRAAVASSVNATDFYQQLITSPTAQTKPMLPGIRIYSTDVSLDNGR